jgi:hypothetical protein
MMMMMMMIIIITIGNIKSTFGKRFYQLVIT